MCQKDEFPFVSNSNAIIDQALETYCDVQGSQPRLERVCLAFNGGKDCTVLLALLLRAITRRYGPDATTKLRLLHICESKSEIFDEVSEFVTRIQSKFDLTLIEVEGKMRPALEQVSREHPDIKAVFMGTRKIDPNASRMNYFCKTDPDWPQIDLVAPILHWEYKDVWTYIRAMGLEYCSLYNCGYTSIGAKSRTAPNPHLHYHSMDGKAAYHPADQLKDGQLERCGRQ